MDRLRVARFLLFLLGLVFLTGGLALTAFNLAGMLRTRSLERWPQAEAAVTKVSAPHAGLAMQTGAMITYSYRVGQKTFEGSEILLRPDPKLAVGAKIRIRYDPHSPHESLYTIPDAATLRFRVFAGAAGFCLGILLIAGILITHQD